MSQFRNHIRPSLSIQELTAEDGFKRLSNGDDSMMRRKSLSFAGSLGVPSSNMRNHFEPKESEELLDLFNQEKEKINSSKVSFKSIADEKKQNHYNVESNKSICNSKGQKRNLRAHFSQSSLKDDASSTILSKKDLGDDVFDTVPHNGLFDTTPIKAASKSNGLYTSILEEDDEEIVEIKPKLDPTLKRLTACKKRNEERQRDARFTKVSALMFLMFLLCHLPRLVTNAIEMVLIARESMFPIWFDVLVSFNHLLVITNSAFNFIILLILTSVSKKKLATMPARRHTIPTEPTSIGGYNTC